MQALLCYILRISGSLTHGSSNPRVWPVSLKTQMVARAPAITSMKAVDTEMVFKVLQLDELDKERVPLEKRREAPKLSSGTPVSKEEEKPAATPQSPDFSQPPDL